MNKLKKEVEQYFLDNWSTSPIQWDEDDSFKAPSDKSWIGINFIPIDRSVIGLDGGSGRKSNLAQVKIFSYGRNPTKALELEDSVRAFFECIDLPLNDARVGLGEPDGFGVVDMQNGLYQSATLYDVKTWR